MLNIKINKDFCVDDFIDYESEDFLGSGSSKDTYLYQGLVYKVPRGVHSFPLDTKYPDTIEGVYDFLYDIAKYDEAMVWSIGQMIMEILVWRELQRLSNEEGFDISDFSPIEDYFLDKNGVLVITQCYEPISWEDYVAEEEVVSKFMDKNEELLTQLDENGYEIQDIRAENLAWDPDRGEPVLFDFGISAAAENIYDFDSYE